MPGVASGKHSSAVLFQDTPADRFGCAQDAGVSYGAAEWRAERDDGSDVLWPLPRDRTGDNASQTVADQMDPAAGLGQRLLHGFIQAAFNQEVRALCVETDAGKEGFVPYPSQPFMQREQVMIGTQEAGDENHS